jgi:predicted branched-subunit amino acid permease
LTFAIPLTFIAIIAPIMRTRAEIAAAVSAGSLAIIGQPLPWNSWLVIAALGGITAGWLVHRYDNTKRRDQ